MKNLLLRLSPIRRKPSTDHALAIFSKARAELTAVIEQESNDIEDINEEIDMLAIARRDASTRRERAQRVASNLEALLYA